MRINDYLIHINLLDYIDKLKLRRKGHSFQCPNYRKHNNDDFNLSAYAYLLPNGLWVWKCYTCGIGGNIIHLIKFAYDITGKDAYNIFIRDNIIPLETKRREKRIVKNKIPNTEELKFLTDLLPTLDTQGKRINDFFSERAISKSTIEQYSIGQVNYKTLSYCKSFNIEFLKKVRLMPYNANRYNQIRLKIGEIIFPVIDDDNNVQSLQIRTLYNSFVTIFSQTYCFGHQLLKNNSRQIMFCEGPTDTLAAYEMGYLGLGILGATQIPINTIRKIKLNNVYIAFDNDEAGRKAQKKWCEKGCISYNIPIIYNDLNEMLIDIKRRNSLSSLYITHLNITS